MMNEITNNAEKVINFITNNAREPVYGLTLSQYFNGFTGEWIKKRCNVDDIGDYLIFIVWYGNLINDPRYTDWAKEQVTIWDSNFKNKFGFYVDEYFPEKKQRPYSVYMYGHQDAFVGLRMLYELTKDKFFLNSLCQLSDATINYAMTKKGFLRGSFLPSFHGIPFPRYSSTFTATMGSVFHKPGVDGIISEEIAALYTITKNEEYLKAAEKIVNAWIDTTEFKNSGLFPDNIMPLFCKPIKPKSSVMKTNTNMISSLIKLYEIKKDSKLLENLVFSLNSLSKQRRKGEEFYTSYNLWKNKPYDLSIDLNMNNSAIMVYIDAYRVLRDEKYLDIAERCAEWYLNRRSEKTGLVPDGDSPYAKLDTVSDFFVNLLKLYEITENNSYLECAIQGMRGISKYHQTEISFIKSVDFQNGKVTDPINETKYLGGYLKFLDYLYYILNGQSALESPTVWDLIRDR